jgi:hypothetical protein
MSGALPPKPKWLERLERREADQRMGRRARLCAARDSLARIIRFDPDRGPWLRHELIRVAKTLRA